jgi:hypothetical protein
MTQRGGHIKGASAAKVVSTLTLPPKQPHSESCYKTARSPPPIATNLRLRRTPCEEGPTGLGEA